MPSPKVLRYAHICCFRATLLGLVGIIITQIITIIGCTQVALRARRAHALVRPLSQVRALQHARDPARAGGLAVRRIIATSEDRTDRWPTAPRQVAHAGAPARPRASSVCSHSRPLPCAVFSGRERGRRPSYVRRSSVRVSRQRAATLRAFSEVDDIRWR